MRESVLHLCIDESQSAFVPGRLITDNIIIAYEMLQPFVRKREGKCGYFALKLDMSKAYSRVEWDFVWDIMLRMGFSSGWIEVIKRTEFYSPEGFSSGQPFKPLLISNL
ncbi:uncharacterized protein LOC120140720 [Hibiscus syriacus]|uniref:uncharacterized protein LOC120140720 n=1 Tax=Hibiscus syriacus TaxID=106335 RepID=UPI001921D2C6|nr:uncharacterized protein LOC120140720 [Hibiscus syriacus]